MAKQIGSVSVAITGDNDDLEDKLKKSGKGVEDFDKKSQTRLKKNQKAWQAWSKKVKAGIVSIKAPLTAVAKGVGITATAGVAGAAAFLAFTDSIVATNRELEILARQANMSVEDFRALSFATGTLGINADTMGGQFEDMRRNLAEFGKVGTGPFQDYADIMGVTTGEAKLLAVELNKLSGEQALQKLVNNMEAANVPMSEMGFVLDSLGSDMDRLIPLFSQGGKEVKQLEKDFKGLSASIDSGDIKQFEELAKNVGIATDNFKTFLIEALEPLTPAFNDATMEIAKFFKTLTEESRKSDAIADKMDRISAAIGGGDKGEFISDAHRVNELSKKNLELEEKINATYVKRYTTTAGMHQAGILKQTEEQFILEQRIAEQEYNANNKLIEQLKEQSAEAAVVLQYHQEIADIKSGETSVEPQSVDDSSAGKGKGKGKGNGDNSGIVSFTEQETNKFIEALRIRMGLTQENLKAGYDKELEMLAISETNKSISKEEADQRRLELERQYWEDKLLLNSENAILLEEKTVEAENLRFEAFVTALENEKLAQENHDAIMRAEKERHEKALTDIEDKANKARKSGNDKAIKNVIAGMNAGNKTLFAIGKAAALSMALLNAKESVVSSYAAGSEIGGPILGGIWGGAAAIAQGANIAQIAGTSFGGGGSPTSYSGGVPVVNTAQAPSFNSQQSQQAPATQINVTLEGNSQSTENVRELIELISDELGDGVTLTAN